MKSLGFIGVGQIGSAFMNGLKEFSTSSKYCYYDTSTVRCQEIEELHGITPEKDIAGVMEKSDITFLSVVPQVFSKVAPELTKYYHKNQIIISALAGINLEDIAVNMPEGAKIARIMPNMALEIGAGTGIMSFNNHVTEEERKALIELFTPLGLIMEVPESLMDAATSLAGSTPGFFYTMLDAMILGGVKIGFTNAEAEKIATWSMYGAAKMLLSSGKSPCFHRDQLMAGYGTTNAGVCILEKRNFRGAVIEAVEESCKQSKEMHKSL